MDFPLSVICRRCGWGQGRFPDFCLPKSLFYIWYLAVFLFVATSPQFLQTRLSLKGFLTPMLNFPPLCSCDWRDIAPAYQYRLLFWGSAFLLLLSEVFQKACHTFHLYLTLHVTPLSLLSTPNIDSVWYHPCLSSALISCILEFYIFCFLLGLLKKEFCEVFIFFFVAVYYPGRFMSITWPRSYQEMQQKIFVQLCINN